MDDAIIRIGAEIADAVSKLSQLSAAYTSFTQQVSKQIGDVGNKVAEQEKFWDSLTLKLFGASTAGGIAANAIMGALDGIVDGIQNVIGFVIELGKRGSDVQNTKLAFDGMTAGLDAYGKVLPEAREKTHGLISDFDLMKSANRAMLFGLDLGATSFGTLGEAAIKLGRAMGQSATKSLDDLVLAIGRIQPRILDNLGIILKANEAYKIYAEAHHKSTTALTGEEKVLAFQLAAMAKIEEKLKSMGPLQLTLADRWTLITVQIRNFLDVVAVALNQSEVLHILFTEIGKAVNDALGGNNQKVASTFVGFVEQIAIWLVKAASAGLRFGQALREEFAEVAALGAGLTVKILEVAEGFLNAHSTFSGLMVKLSFGQHEATNQADRDVKKLLGSVTSMRESANKDFQELVKTARGTDAWGQATSRAAGFLDNLAVKLEDARGKKVTYAASTAVVTKAQHEDNTATERAAKLKEQLTKRITDMSIKLGDTQITEENLAEVTKEWGNQIGHLIRQAELSGVKIPENVRKWAEAIENARLDEIIRKNADAMRDAGVKMFGQMVKDAETGVKESGKTFDHLKDIYEKTTNEMNLIGKSGYQKDLANLDLKLKEETRKLGDVPQIYSRKYEEARGLINMQFDLKNRDLDEAMKQEIKKIGPIPDQYNAKYEAAVRSVKMKYMEMQAAEEARRQVEINGLGATPGAYEEAYRKAKEALIAQNEQATEALAYEERKRIAAMRKTWSVDFIAVLGDIPKIIQQALTGGGGWEGATQAIIAKIGETFGGRAITGALSGIFNQTSNWIAGHFGTSIAAAIGTAIPGIGSAIGAMVGPLLDKVIGFFKGKPEHEKIMEDVGKRFGTKISDGLSKQIQADAAKYYGGVHYIAEIFNLDKIIGEAGGLTSKNYDQFIGKLRDVFVFVEQGKITTQQAGEILDKNFSAFAKHLVDSGKQASAQFLELIALNQRMGTESAEIAKFVEERSSTAAKGLGALLGPIKSVYGTLGEELDKAKDKVRELEEAGKTGSSEHGKAVEELNKLLAKQKEGQAANGEEVQRVGRLTLATFNAQIGAGVSWLDAIENIAPALDDLIVLQKSLGIENSNAAVQELIRFRNLTTQNKELVAAVGGLNDTMLALQHIGALNADTLSDLEAQGLSMYGKLTAAGFTEREALVQMKGWLEQVIQSHKDLGIPVDENTQKLINQAREQGILRAEGMSTNDILIQGIGALIEAVGGKLPEAFRRMRDASNEAGGAARWNLDTSAGSAANARGNVESVGGAAAYVRDQVNSVPWENWKDRGVNAAWQVKNQVMDTAGGFDTVAWKLDQSANDFATWSWETKREVWEVKNAVDSVSFGSSPGGIKEWAIKLRESIREFRRWSDESITDIEKVRGAVDSVSFGIRADARIGSSVVAGGIATAGTSIVQNVTIDAKGAWVEQQETLQRWGAKAGEALANQYFSKRRVAAVGEDI